MKASEIINGLLILIVQFGDKDVIALGEVEEDEFYKIDHIVDTGNEEDIAPYILALTKE